mgnify:CR=1 FL=1
MSITGRILRSNVDMTHGKPLTVIFSFALPLLVGNLFNQLYNVVDTAIVGRALGADALAAVGMSEFTRHAPHLLSGGQKQRVAIAGVIAMAPECIVLDEATAMLDPAGRREVLSAIRALNQERGITVVLITHHMDEAMDADRLIVMNDGKLVIDGAPAEVFTQVEALRAMGLAAPDTVELLYGLRQGGMDVPLDALTVDECADAICKALR